MCMGMTSTKCRILFLFRGGVTVGVGAQGALHVQYFISYKIKMI